MPEEKKVKVEPVRLVVRIHIPSVDPGLIGDLHSTVKAAVKSFSGAEIELNVLPTVRSM